MNWKFYLAGKDALEAMLADCEAATETIDIEQFIFSPNGIGKRFLDVLENKRNEGIKIRILADAVGSSDLRSSAVVKQLAALGIKIKFFNPIQPWRIGNFSSWFLRDHRKLLIIDKKIVHTGGVGIEGRMNNWRDTNVRLEGLCVREAISAFEQMWNAAPKKKFYKFKPVITEDTDFSFLINAPRFKNRYIYKNLLSTIKNSQKYLYITTPYFVPSIRIFSALRRAAKRGVDVRLLLPKSSDVHIADVAAGSYFILALKAGIKIYLYSSSHILHSKTAVADDVWGSVGSANMDNLSLLLNHEGNIVSRNSEFIQELKSHFLEDIKSSESLTQNKWKNRPLIRKVLEFITWSIHQVL